MSKNNNSQQDRAEALHDEIMECARGVYQESLLRDNETWSGSSLQGKAKKWGAKYAQSRGNLYSRICSVVHNHGGWCDWEAGTAHTGPRHLVVYLGSVRVGRYGAHRDPKYKPTDIQILAEEAKKILADGWVA